jgi:hypothetical protein
MDFPLDYQDASILIATLSIVLLITLEVINPSNSRINFILEKKRLKRVAMIMFYVFIMVVSIRLLQFITL